MTEYGRPRTFDDHEQTVSIINYWMKLFSYETHQTSVSAFYQYLLTAEIRTVLDLRNGFRSDIETLWSAAELLELMLSTFQHVVFYDTTARDWRHPRSALKPPVSRGGAPPTRRPP